MYTKFQGTYQLMTTKALAPEFEGTDYKEIQEKSIGKLEETIPCLLQTKCAEDGKACGCTCCFGLLGGGAIRCGKIKSCNVVAPLYLCVSGLGCGLTGCYSLFCSPLFCINSSCGETSGCNICLGGFGGGYAAISEMEPLSWLCCFTAPLFL